MRATFSKSSSKQRHRQKRVRLSSSKPPLGRHNVIAIQLYTVRTIAANDMLGTIRKLGEVGYKAVEFAGYGNSNPKEIRPVLDESGIRAISAHVPVADFES